MKVSTTPVALLWLLLAGFSAAESPPAKAKAHGITVNGRVTRVDPSKKILAVREAGGRETPLSWTSATKIAGGALKTGDAVTVRYFDKDSRHIATYIRINAPVTAGPMPAAQTPTPLVRG